MIDLNNSEVIINKVIVDKDDLCYDEKTKEYFTIFDIYNSLTQEIIAHNFCIIFRYTTRIEEKEITNKGVSWQKQVLQQSINDNCVDIDFLDWNKKTIVVDIYVVKQDECLKGFNFGLKSTNREKRFRK